MVLITIGIGHYTVALLFIVYPFTFVKVSILKSESSFSKAFPLNKVSFIFFPIDIFYTTPSIQLVVLPLSIYKLSIQAVEVAIAVRPLSLKYSTIGISDHSHAGIMRLFEFAFVYISILHRHLSIAFNDLGTFQPLTFVYISIVKKYFWSLFNYVFLGNIVDWCMR